jgi:hypothetical protein
LLCFIAGRFVADMANLLDVQDSSQALEPEDAHYSARNEIRVDLVKKVSSGGQGTVRDLLGFF